MTYEKRTIYVFKKKNPSDWRITQDSAYYEKLNELQDKYPLGELYGDVHEEQEFIAYVKVESQAIANEDRYEPVYGYEEQVIYVFKKSSEDSDRITTNEAYYDKLLELQTLYPLNKMYGDVYTELKFVALVYIRKD